MIRQIWFQNRQNNEKNRSQARKTKEAQHFVFNNLKGRIPLLFYCVKHFTVSDNLKLI
jgi:hypothetical protein